MTVRSEIAARLDGVTKRYGRHTALNELNLSIPKGVICALVGPNGSGKTTTMGVLSGLIRPQSGRVSLFEEGDFDPERHAGRISVMPQDSNPSGHVPLGDILAFYAELQGMTRARAKQEAAAWLQRVHLDDRSKAKFGTLSHGMRRRFSVAQAMLGDPELILLDEPTSGLDPELVVEIRRLIIEHRGRATVLVSSHVLSELESMCDYAVFLEQGRCVRQGPMSEVTGRDTVVRYVLDRELSPSELRAALPDCTVSTEGKSLTVRAPGTQGVVATNAACLRWLLDHGVGVVSLEAGESLESAYLASKR